MRFLVDECTGSKAANWLRDENYKYFRYLTKLAE